MECLGFFVLLYMVGGAMGLLAWVLHPLRREASRRGGPIQFTVADVFCLFVLIQTAMTIVHWRMPLEVRGSAAIWLLDGLAGLGVGLLWFGGVRSLSRAGVTGFWHRALLLVVIFPASVIAAILLPVLLLLVFTSLQRPYGPDAGILGGLLLAMIAALAGSAWWVRRLGAPGRRE